MKKSKQVGPISFSETGYEKFVSLSKDKQLEKVTEALNPKDPKQAEKILAHVPNGDISTGNDTAAESSETAVRAGDKETDSSGSGIDTRKSNRVQKG